MALGSRFLVEDSVDFDSDSFDEVVSTILSSARIRRSFDSEVKLTKQFCNNIERESVYSPMDSTIVPALLLGAVIMSPVKSLTWILLTSVFTGSEFDSGAASVTTLVLINGITNGFEGRFPFVVLEQLEFWSSLIVEAGSRFISTASSCS